MERQINLPESTQNPLHSTLSSPTCRIERHENVSLLAQDIFQLKSSNLSTESKLTKKLESRVIIYLVLLGALAGVVNGIVIESAVAISKLQATLIAMDGGNYTLGLFTFMITTGKAIQSSVVQHSSISNYLIYMAAIFVYMAAWLCKNVSNKAAGITIYHIPSLFLYSTITGSGLPELKSLLSSDLKNNESEKLVNKRALFSKVIGLVRPCKYQ